MCQIQIYRKDVTPAKSNDSIVIKQDKYHHNPFKAWIGKLSTNKAMMVASIPFIRNLAEYCGFKAEYNSLTSLLHIKDDTNSITIGILESIFKRVLQGHTDLALEIDDRPIKQIIYNISDVILKETNEKIDLEEKIVLSIAIRLKTEEFLIQKINDPSFVKSIKKNQTNKLIDKYKEKYNQEVKIIKLLEQVKIMTPENIHINSFMYEPILDMSNEHLKKLYKKISKDLKVQ